MIGHRWTSEPDGRPDIFAHELEMDGIGHNGPRCEVCGFFFCRHCSPLGWDTSCPITDDEWDRVT